MVIDPQELVSERPPRQPMPHPLQGLSFPLRLILTITRLRLPRVWSNALLRAIGPLLVGEVINVSAANDRDKQGHRYKTYFPNATRYYVSNYEGELGLADSADISDFSIDLTQPLPRELVGRFDVVFNHTTLEHIYDMHTAFRHLCQLSRDVVIVVVPFAQHLHPSTSWGDYWRFTPMSLRRMFTENGLDVVFESYSPFANAPIYLFAMGSRDPDHWRHRLPDWSPIEAMGGWIGRPILPALVEVLKRLNRRLRTPL